MVCQDREYSVIHTTDNAKLDGDSIMTSYGQIPTSDDAVFRLKRLSEDPTTPPSPAYGIRSTPKHAYKPFRPATPRRSPTPSDSGSPGSTPTWARPLQLVKDEISVYKNLHGDKSHEHPLCLYCFRQHGDFHRIVGHHCEVCGRIEVLKGHYWEAPFST